MTPVKTPRSSRLIGPWLAASVTMTILSPAAHAQNSVYSARTGFNLGSGSLSNEGFENSTAGSNRVILGPINSTTQASSSLVVVPGFSVQAVGTSGVPGSGQNQIYYNSTLYNSGDGTNVLTTDYAADSLDVTFGSSYTTAFGVNLGSTGAESDYTVTVFSSSGTLLDTTDVALSPGSFTFFGITTTQAISRVNISNTGLETVDNLSFGTAAAPEPGTLPLAFLGGAPLLLGVTIARRLRRH